MVTSSAREDCSVAMAMVSLAQRWCGSSTPVNILSADELHLLEPLDATPPLAVHMFHELRMLGYKVAVGWVARSPEAGDETIYDAHMREAGIAGRTEAKIARMQRWRRDHNVMWVSEMFRAGGITLNGRCMTNLVARARRCEPDAIRLCYIAFGRGRGPGNQSGRPHVGLPTPAAWGAPSASAATCGATVSLAVSAQKDTPMRRSLCPPRTPHHGELQPERM